MNNTKGIEKTCENCKAFSIHNELELGWCICKTCLIKLSTQSQEAIESWLSNIDREGWCDLCGNRTELLRVTKKQMISLLLKLAVLNVNDKESE